MVLYIIIELQITCKKTINLQRKIDILIIIDGVFNKSLLITDRTSRQKISKDVEHLDNTINQSYLIKKYRLFHLETKCTFFQVHIKHLSKINHIQGKKQVLLNLRVFVLYRICCVTILQLKSIIERHVKNVKYLKIKYYISKQPRSQRRNVLKKTEDTLN